jgi:glycerate kinase
MFRRCIHPVSLLLLLLAFVAAVPGCGGGGGEATFAPSEAQTQAEIEEADNYMQDYQKQQEQMRQQQN